VSTSNRFSSARVFGEPVTLEVDKVSATGLPMFTTPLVGNLLLCLLLTSRLSTFTRLSNELQPNKTNLAVYQC